MNKSPSMKSIDTSVMLPSIKNNNGSNSQHQRQVSLGAHLIVKKKPSIRNVNFRDEPDGLTPGLSHSASAEKLSKQINISQEIQRLIPVRGPTLFDKQLNEFVNGVASKSGMKNAMMRGLSKKTKEIS